MAGAGVRSLSASTQTQRILEPWCYSDLLFLTYDAASNAAPNALPSEFVKGRAERPAYRNADRDSGPGSWTPVWGFWSDGEVSAVLLRQTMLLNLHAGAPKAAAELTIARTGDWRCSSAYGDQRSAHVDPNFVAPREDQAMTAISKSKPTAPVETAAGACERAAAIAGAANAIENAPVTIAA
jgi:hypothetical protein